MIEIKRVISIIIAKASEVAEGKKTAVIARAEGRVELAELERRLRDKDQLVVDIIRAYTAIKERVENMIAEESSEEGSEKLQQKQ